MSVSLLKSPVDHFIPVTVWAREWSTADLNAQLARQYELINEAYTDEAYIYIPELEFIARVISLELWSRQQYGTWFNLLRDPEWSTDRNGYGSSISVRATQYVTGHVF